MTGPTKISLKEKTNKLHQEFKQQQEQDTKARADLMASTFKSFESDLMATLQDAKHTIRIGIRKLETDTLSKLKDSEVSAQQQLDTSFTKTMGMLNSNRVEMRDQAKHLKRWMIGTATTTIIVLAWLMPSEVEKPQRGIVIPTEGSHVVYNIKKKRLMTCALTEKLSQAKCTLIE